jgi:hypothetical protein
MFEKLSEIANEIRDIITQKQNEMSLSFIEDTHTYYIKDVNGDIINNFPSVSTVLKAFYQTFDSTSTKSFKYCDGNIELQKELLMDWKSKGDLATNMGSYVHFMLEQELINQYGSYKTVRSPKFNCNSEQIRIGDSMIKSGLNFIERMHKRGAVLLDTEMVLGSTELGITGQPDKVWLMFNKKGELGLVITDWKTNSVSNMSQEVKPWTLPMLSPFDFLYNNTLNHYKIQLPLYARLLLKMLEGTKYSEINLFTCVITHLTEDSFKEYLIEKEIIDLVLNLDIKSILIERKDHILEHKRLEKRDQEIINS